MVRKFRILARERSQELVFLRKYVPNAGREMIETDSVERAKREIEDLSEVDRREYSKFYIVEVHVVGTLTQKITFRAPTSTDG